MDEKIIFHWLKGVPFFSDFSAEQLQRLAGEKKYILKFSNDQTIIKEGNIDKTLFILLKGRARLTKRTSKNVDATITHLNDGAVCGAMFLISKKERPYQCSLISEGQSTFVGLTHDFFKTLEPGLQMKLKEQLMELVFTRLDNLIAKHADLMGEMLI